MVFLTTFGAVAHVPASASHDGRVDAGCPRDRVPWRGFVDVDGGNVHRFTIDCVAWWGVTQGITTDRYAPARLVRRDEMASFIARTMESAGYRLPSQPRTHFADIQGNVHALRIRQLADVGVVQGIGRDRYAPAQRVSRAQMATFLVRSHEIATGRQLPTTRRHFDDTAGNPHARSIDKAAEAGIAQGTGPRRYGPGGAVRRDQMASFLARTLDTSVERGHATAPVPASRPPDPLEGAQWGLHRIDAPGAWRVATGRGVIVAVVDSGVDPDHPELAGRLLRGASWVDCPGAPPCDRWQDENGHGTHVAGIIAAARDGRGTVGVAPEARIMPVRVLDENGEGSFADVAAGIRYAVDNGAQVLNLSLGTLPIYSQVVGLTGTDGGFSAAIAYAISRGALVVAASGNTYLPMCSSHALLRADQALCVGATNRSDQRATYANFWIGVHVVAPGGISPSCSEGVLSTLRTGTANCDRPSGYGHLYGTSMAAPHVSGIGALLAENGVTGQRAAERIIATTERTGSLHGVFGGHDPFHGFGRVNATRAVRSG